MFNIQVKSSLLFRLCGVICKIRDHSSMPIGEHFVNGMSSHTCKVWHTYRELQNLGFAPDWHLDVTLHPGWTLESVYLNGNHYCNNNFINLFRGKKFCPNSAKIIWRTKGKQMEKIQPCYHIDASNCCGLLLLQIPFKNLKSSPFFFLSPLSLPY